MAPTQKFPGPDHPIVIEPAVSTVVIKVGGIVIADTNWSMKITEAHYPAVFYISKDDVDFKRLIRSDHVTYCPYKGECHYFHIVIGSVKFENAVWSYEAPYAVAEPIKGYLAFDPTYADINASS